MAGIDEGAEADLGEKALFTGACASVHYCEQALRKVPALALVVSNELHEGLVAVEVSEDCSGAHAVMRKHIDAVDRGGGGHYRKVLGGPGFEKTFFSREGEFLCYAGTGHTRQSNNVSVLYERVDRFASGIEVFVFHLFSSTPFIECYHELHPIMHRCFRGGTLEKF